MDLGSLVLRIIADAKPLQESLVGVKGELNKLDQSLTSSGRGFTDLFAGLGTGAVLGGLAGITAGVVGIGAGLVSCVSAASSLNESLNKADVVFGPAAGEVTRAAEQMAAQFGISKREFVDAASNIGLIGEAAGMNQGAAAGLAVEMAKLAVDASSFNDVPFAVALEKIRSGLVGESEPLRQFGVLLSETAVKAEGLRLGLETSGEHMSEADKVAARVSLIREGLTAASGDMERTADSVANLTRSIGGRIENMMADIGEGLMPIASTVLQEVGAGVQALGGFFAANKDAIHDWATVVSAEITDVVSTMQALAEGVGLAAEGLVELGHSLLIVQHFGEVDWSALNPLLPFVQPPAPGKGVGPTTPENVDERLVAARDQIAQKEKRRERGRDAAEAIAKDPLGTAAMLGGLMSGLTPGGGAGGFVGAALGSAVPTRETDAMEKARLKAEKDRAKEGADALRDALKSPLGAGQALGAVLAGGLPGAGLGGLLTEGILGNLSRRELPKLTERMKGTDERPAAARTEELASFAQRLQESAFGRGDVPAKQLDEQKKGNEHLAKIAKAIGAPQQQVATAVFAS